MIDFLKNLNYKPHIIFVQSIDALSQNNLTQKHDISGKLYINPYKKYYKKERKMIESLIALIAAIVGLGIGYLVAKKSMMPNMKFS